MGGSTNTLSNMFKEVYGEPWSIYERKGAKEELILRLRALSALEKSILGIEDDDEQPQDNKGEMIK